MTSVWIVEEGEYSAYQVVAIFASQQQAEQFVAHRKLASCREWVLDTWTEDKAVFEFEFDYQGNVARESEEAYTDTIDSSHWNEVNPEQVMAWVSDPHIRVRVHRGPRDLALKIASERYARIRSSLDQAQELVSRSGLWTDPRERSARLGLTGMVAEVIAGVRALPAGEPGKLSGYDTALLQVIALRQ